MNRDARSPSPSSTTPTESWSAAVGLSGKRIVVTRAPHQASEMADLLRNYSSEPVFYPCIDIVPPGDTALLDGALQEAAKGKFNWLVITSANTVLILSKRLNALGLSLSGVRVAAVGPKTAAAIRKTLRIDVQVIAGQYVAETLAAELQPVAGQRILLPQSKIARPVLADRLRAAGAEVTAVEAYRTVVGQGGEDVPALLAAGQIDAVTFTSASTVRHFLGRLENEGGKRDSLAGVCLAAIGPVTADAIREADLPVAVMPAEYTLPSLVAALEAYFSGER